MFLADSKRNWSNEYHWCSSLARGLGGVGSCRDSYRGGGGRWGTSPPSFGNPPPPFLSAEVFCFFVLFLISTKCSIRNVCVARV